MSTPAIRLSEQPQRKLEIVRDKTTSPPSMPLAALRVPLAVKLVGANALGLLIFSSVWLYLDRDAIPAVLLALFLVLLAVHPGLALVALRPIRDLEALAESVWSSANAARFRDSAVADHEVLRVGTMFNRLLD